MLIEDDIDIAKELEIAEKAAESEPPADDGQNAEATPVPVADSKPAEQAPEEPEKAVESQEKQEKRGDPAVALRIARKEAKELKEQLRKQAADHQAAVQALSDRLNSITNPPKAKPTFEEDPLTHLKTELDETKAKSEQLERATQIRQVEAQIQTTLDGYERTFIAEHPDYQEAAGHYVKTVAANMELLGVPKEQIQAQIRNQIMQITVNSVRAGKDPAEVVYGMAHNLGFSSKAKADAAASEAKLAQMAKGQEASQSLSSGGKSEAGKLTLDVLAKMDDDDFNALLLDDKKWHEIGRLMH